MSPQAVKARKGEETRAQILDAAVQQASEAGFESLTIGTLAGRTGLSKSGLFAHFGSRTDLQIAALDEAARRFTEAVFLPALKAPRGAEAPARPVRATGSPGRSARTCAAAARSQAASAEYDDQPGPMRDAVVERQRSPRARARARRADWRSIAASCAADTDPRQFVFEMYGIVLAYYHTQRLLGDRAATRARAFARVRPPRRRAPRARRRQAASRPAAARR